MKILLINPPYDADVYFGRLARLRYVFAPMGLLSLAAYLRREGHEVRVYDFEVSTEDFEGVLRDYAPELAGMTTPTILVDAVRRLSHRIKKLLPSCHIVVGGPHPSVRPRDLFISSEVDFAVRGEGEVVASRLVRCLSRQEEPRNVPGLTYRWNGSIRDNPDTDELLDLGTLPLPAYDLVPLEKYRPSPDLMLGTRAAAIFTSRGCPYRCIFCANNISFKYSYRLRPLSQVYDELAFYLDTHRIDSFMIMDDTFCIQEKRVEEFCNALIQKGWHKKLSWWAQTRVDKISPELASLMKEAGCKTLSLGMESGVERLLTLIKKDIHLDQARAAVRAVKQAGITARASFILGLPTESLKDSLRTIAFAMSLPLDFCKFSLATPYPGTELWDIVIKEKGASLEGRWDDFTQMAGFASSNPLYVPKGRSAKALKNLQKCANALYYLKPSVLIGMFMRFRRMGRQKEFFATILTGVKAVILPVRLKRHSNNRVAGGR